MTGADAAVDDKPQSSADGDGDCRSTPPPLSKATKAAWKRTLKQLKLKDVGKKVEAIHYCATDSRFFREGGAIALLMALLTRAKQHEVLSQALVMFSRLVASESDPADSVANALFILEEGLNPATPWNGAEYFLAIVSMAVDDSMKTTAMAIFTKLVEACYALPPSHPNRSELVASVISRGEPIAQCSLAIASPNIALQYSGLNAVVVFSTGHPDPRDVVSRLECLDKIVAFVLHDDARFSHVALQLVEFVSRFGTSSMTATMLDVRAVDVGQTSSVHANAPATLTTKLQMLVAAAAPADSADIPESVFDAMELTARILTRLHVNMPSEDDNLLLAGVSHLVAALATASIKQKIRAATASVHLSCLGRLMERFERCKTHVKQLAIMTTLVHYLVMDETTNLTPRAVVAADATDNKGKAAKGGGGKPGKDKKESPAKETASVPPTPASPDVPGDLDPTLADAMAKDAALAAEKAAAIFLQVRHAAEKILHLCAIVDSSGAVDARIFGASVDGDPWMQYDVFQTIFGAADPSTILRGVRFMALAAQHSNNCGRIGIAGAQSLVGILSDQTKQQLFQDGVRRELDAAARQSYAALVAYIADALSKVSAGSQEICELCGDEALSPVTALVDFVVENSTAGTMDVVNPLNHTWGCPDATIVELAFPKLTYKPQVLAAETLAILARTVLDFAAARGDDPSTPPLTDRGRGKDKKAKEAMVLVGERVAQQIAKYSLKLLDLLATLSDLDLHAAVLLILESIPYLPNGRKTLLRQAQEQIVADRSPPHTDATAAINAMDVIPPEGLAVGEWPYRSPIPDMLQAHARLLQPVLHVFHRPDSLLRDIVIALRLLRSLFVDDKAPQDEYSLDVFANVAVCTGVVVVLTSLLDVVRLQDDLSRDVNQVEELQALVRQLLQHLARLGRLRESTVVPKLEAFIADEEDTSDSAKEAVDRAKSIASRWIELLSAPHDFARFGYIGHSALLVAIDIGDTEVANLLMETGVSAATAVDSSGNSSLTKALSTGSQDMISCVLHGGANVEAMNLHDDSVLKFCLISTDSIRSSSVESAMTTLRHAKNAAASDVFAAALVTDSLIRETSPMELLQMCLERGSDPNVSDADGSFPLHWVLSKTHVRTHVRGCRVCLSFDSTRLGSADVVALAKLLLDHHANVNVANKLGQTPLHVAVLNGHGAAARVLLDHGAHPFMVDQYGCLPLHYLCGGSCGDATIPLIDAMLGVSTKFQLTASEHVDLRKGKTRAEKTLVDLDAILDAGLASVIAPKTLTTRPSSPLALLTHTSSSGLFPFHYACGAKEPQLDFAETNIDTAPTRLAVLQHLVKAYRVDLGQPTTHRLNALHFAAKFDRDGSNGALLGFLLEQQCPLDAVHDPKPISVPRMLPPMTRVRYHGEDGHEIASISTVSSAGSYDIITQASGQLVSDVPRSALTCVASKDDGLALAAEFAFAPVHYAVLHSDNATWQLLHAGAAVIPEGSDVPLLALACAAQRSLDVIEYLAPRLASQANVRVELTEELSGTALHFAVSLGNIDVARILLDSAQATIKVKRPSDGYTPMHIACERGMKEMVLFLAARNAFNECSGGNDTSPLLLLVAKRHKQILEALMEVKLLSDSQMEDVAAFVHERAQIDGGNEWDEWSQWIKSVFPLQEEPQEPNQDDVHDTEERMKCREEEEALPTHAIEPEVFTT
ncbi:hypothetical protein AeRB84_001849 [Aphanomyces euteiches]|nr:hypothetical protein AeRB84_001849 [Aphanomyces euteiches]